MSDFIHIGKYAVNPHSITVMDFTKPDSVMIQLGSSSAIEATGDDAKKLHDKFGPKAEPKPDANGAAKPTPEAATQATTKK